MGQPSGAAADDEAQPGQGRLKRTLGPVDLTALGIGAIIGAGIFSSTGTAAAGGGEHVGAGPALVVSYILTAVACGFAALCYGAGALGVATMRGARRPGLWFRVLRKSPVQPPDRLFGPVWSALYAAIAYSAWRIWRAPASP